MRLPVRTAAVAGLVATLATPCLAVTVVQPPQGSDAPVSRFSDPDEALESTGSQIRDTVVDNNLRAQGGAAFTGGSRYPYGYTSQTSNFGPATVTTQTYSDGFSGGFNGPAVYAPPVLLPFAGRPR